MSEQQAKLVSCPNCKTNIIWSSNNPNRPFCSERCRNKDFVAWANQENAMAGDSTYDDLLSGDIPDQNNY